MAMRKDIFNEVTWGFLAPPWRPVLLLKTLCNETMLLQDKEILRQEVLFTFLLKASPNTCCLGPTSLLTQPNHFRGGHKVLTHQSKTLPIISQTINIHNKTYA